MSRKTRKERLAKCKTLSKRIATVQAELEAKNEEARAIRITQKNLQNRLDKLQQQLAEASLEGELCVTDHAVVQYLERVMGIDTDELREVIAAGNHELLDGKFPVQGENGSWMIVVKDNAVVTVLESRQARQQAIKARKKS